jgi:hypothetical protein
VRVEADAQSQRLKDWPRDSSQLGDVAGNAPRLVHGEDVGNVGIGFALAPIDVCERLAAYARGQGGMFARGSTKQQTARPITAAIQRTLVHVWNVHLLLLLAICDPDNHDRYPGEDRGTPNVAAFFFVGAATAALGSPT